MARLLADRYRLVLMDRRGHGSSAGVAGIDGATGRDALVAECEDLEAMLGELDGPVNLLGHSIGAAIALSACMRSNAVMFDRIVAIEPPLIQDLDLAKVAHFRDMLAAGRYEDAVIWGFRDIQGLSEKVLDRIRRSPRNWAGIVASAPMMARHWDMSLAFPGIAEFAHLRIPTLLLYGSRSEERPFCHSTRALAAVMPDSRLEAIEGHNHVSMARDPGPVATRVRDFLELGRGGRGGDSGASQ